MKKIYCLLPFLALLASIAFVSCSEEETEPYSHAEKEFSFSGFDKLNVSGNLINVNLVQADSFSIIASGHAPNISDLDIHKDAGTLFIEYDGAGNRSYPTFITMTMPDINKLHLADNVHGLFFINNMPYMEVSLLDESSLNLNGRIDTVNVSVSEESSITLAGEGNRLLAMVVYSSMLTAYDFPVESGRLDVIGNGYAEIHVTDTLTIDVALESEAYYRGVPSINASVDGSSTFQPD